jgi:hypothetical protein
MYKQKYQKILNSRYLKVPQNIKFVRCDFIGIVQTFELEGETRLIRFALKYWKPGKFEKKILRYNLTSGA